MAKQLVIDPVTRIEGHAKITLQLNEDGRVEDAMFHVTQFRGFEKLCEGRPFTEMPSLMARICGICPVSHLMSSSKACDAVMAVSIPETAANLRRVMNLAQFVQSHALSFFHLCSPDLMLGMDADPGDRNIFGMMAKFPELTQNGVRLRKFGQQVIEWLGGKRIHPAWVVPGGVNEPLSTELRDRILEQIPDMLSIIKKTLEQYKRSLEGYHEETRTFANFPSLFMALVNPQNEFAHYDGKLRFVDGSGRIVADGIEANQYSDYIAEAVEPWTYLKFPYYKPIGYPDGIYRVGPLARLNVIENCGSPLANQEWAEFRSLGRGVVLSSFHYHYARLIEIVYSLEKIQMILDDPKILNKHVRAHAGVNNLEGVGISEAPRGTLIHHYKVNEDGLMTHANLIIATGHNNLAMNRGVLQVARHYVDNKKLKEGMLNRVEAVVRAFDPCLSCSTHAVGKMAFQIQLRDAGGLIVDEIQRH
ncbi:MAG: Ni/Fe hydrogenase subunit alpha [Candidatus Omnitrophica bacterium]|nr:Ni/Fe hydrogenase subunit alpha [Candidatus Omnitrophota bacterium]